MSRNGRTLSISKLTALVVFMSALAACGPKAGIERPVYGTGTWDAETLGNHRAVVRVTGESEAALVRIPWRRRDLSPDKKNIIIVDADTGNRIENVCPLEINREFGDIVFETPSAPGEYFIYYMPYVMSGRSNYPTVTYPEFAAAADPAWLESRGLEPFRTSTDLQVLPRADVLSIESIDEFNSFFPMEIIATREETEAILAGHPDGAYLCFPEDRFHPIRMTDDLPLRWVRSGPRTEFQGEAAPGEYYTFQIGLYAARTSISDVEVRFEDLKSGKHLLAAEDMTCFNTGGIDWDGRPFDKTCSVEEGKIQALWCGIQIPEEARSGTYRGSLTVEPEGLPDSRIEIELKVAGEVFEDAGDGDIRRHSRLRWLNSRLAFDDELVPPFTPMTVSDLTIGCLGREITLDATGLPARIRSYFSPEVTHIQNSARDLLSGPISLLIAEGDGSIRDWSGEPPRITKQAPGAVAWESESSAGAFRIQVRGQMELDGCAAFEVVLTAAEGSTVGDIRLEMPLNKDVARYMMGLGFKGGKRPETFSWAWDRTRNQDALWIGDVNAGLQCSFRAENYARPLNTNFYLSKPLNMPPSWFNEGRGGVRVTPRGKDSVVVTAFSGPRTVQAGEALHFNFNLLLTPFKPLDTDTQWRTRFYHAFEPIEKIAATGADTVNNHHANDANPYINYPFIHTGQMKAYIDEAHARGMKVKIYNTIRELSNRAAEIFALRSLGEEIFSPGPGGGFSWLQEHLGGNYIAAWFVPKLKDAAVINSGMSRWHNYYIEGLNWLTKNIGIDGLYLDDVAFDRTTMKRLRKILDRNRPEALIDLHSANQYNPRDGFASSANLYLEHFPYLNRLWFGEYFDYGSLPDYWLIEISGIPFGLMGEMLQDGGNAWRGMVYGMTSRLPWAGDPRPVWKVWDSFGMEGSRMMGYWSPNNPVKTGHPNVLATSYLKEDSALIALASWAAEPVRIRLALDKGALGFAADTAALEAPEIENFQPAAVFPLSGTIPVEPGKGWLLILK